MLLVRAIEMHGCFRFAAQCQHDIKEGSRAYYHSVNPWTGPYPPSPLDLGWNSAKALRTRWLNPFQVLQVTYCYLGRPEGVPKAVPSPKREESGARFQRTLAIIYFAKWRDTVGCRGILRDSHDRR